MKIFNKLVLIAVALISFTFTYAQGPSTPPPGTGSAPGGTTPGAQSIPVDMYVYALAVVALMLVVFFARKYNSQKI